MFKIHTWQLTGQCPKLFGNFGSRKKVEKWQFSDEFGRTSRWKWSFLVCNTVLHLGIPVIKLFIWIIKDFVHIIISLKGIGSNNSVVNSGNTMEIFISEIRANFKIRRPSDPTLPGSLRFDCTYIRQILLHVWTRVMTVIQVEFSLIIE